MSGMAERARLARHGAPQLPFVTSWPGLPYRPRDLACRRCTGAAAWSGGAASVLCWRCRRSCTAAALPPPLPPPASAATTAAAAPGCRREPGAPAADARGAVPATPGARAAAARPLTALLLVRRRPPSAGLAGGRGRPGSTPSSACTGARQSGRAAASTSQQWGPPAARRSGCSAAALAGCCRAPSKSGALGGELQLQPPRLPLAPQAPLCSGLLELRGARPAPRALQFLA